MHRNIQTAAVALALLLVSAAVAPAAATALDRQPETYAGTHVSFDASANAVTDYTVDGATVVSSVKTESKAAYTSRTSASLGVELDSVTQLEGAALSMSAKTNAQATVTAESGAKLNAHDNTHGILVVESGGESQLVKANVSSGTSAEATADDRVVVTTESGAQGTFIVVGEGSVDVNSEGDVVAEIGSDGKLVFRAYDDGNRDANAKAHEKLIANGSAAGEVYVMTEDGGETVTDTVEYSQETTITAKQSAENEVAVTIDRAKHDGQVVITQVSESAVGAADSVEVAVDGEAAVEASSYSEVVAASNGGETSKYMVRQTAQMQAQGSAEVLVGVNHFSERIITMSGADDGGADDATSTADGDSDGSDANSTDGTATDGDSDGSDGSDSGADDGEDSTATSTPGFGLIGALLAIAGAALVTRRSA